MIKINTFGFLILISVLILFTKCSQKDIKIEIGEYDGNRIKALYSKVKVINDKIILIGNDKLYNGEILITDSSKTFEEITILNGEIIKLILFDKKGLEYSSYIKLENKLIFKTSSESFRSECVWPKFSNLNLINRNIDDEEHTCTIKMKHNGDEAVVTVSVNYDKTNNLVVTEMNGQTKNSNKVLSKAITYKRILKDSTVISVSFIEDFEKGFKYNESIEIVKGLESFSLSTSYQEGDGDITIYVSLENFNGKNCKASDALFYSSSLFNDLKLEESTCVSDGLKIATSYLDNQLTRNTIKKRFMDKKRNNHFFSKEQQDIDFYF